MLDLREFFFRTEAEFEERVPFKLSLWQDSIVDSFNKLTASVNLEKLDVPASSINLNQTSLADKTYTAGKYFSFFVTPTL